MNSIPKLLLDYLSYVINVAVAGAWVYHSVRGSLRRRVVRNFFGGKRITIYLPLREQAEHRMMIADEDFLGALDLSNFLRAYGLELDLRRIPPTGTFDFDAPAIIICGPKTCEAVRDLYASDQSYRLEQRTSRWEILDVITGNHLISPLDRTPAENKDLAYVARISVGRGRALLLGGLHAAGSYGAIHFLTNYASLHKLSKEVRSRKFSVILSTVFNPTTKKISGTDIHLAVRKN